MNPATLTPSTFTLVQQGQSSPLSASVCYAGPTATLDPSANLQAGTTYTATLKGGPSGAKDVAGNPLAADSSWTFTTAAGANQPPAPVIDSPSTSLAWRVGETIAFTGHASDPEQGALPASALSWTLLLQHCPSTCHTHTLQSWPGVSGSSFAAPDHDYPSHLELRLTATDSANASTTTTLRLDPRTVVLTFASQPSGLQLSVGGVSSATPFSRNVIVGSTNSLTAISPQALAGTTYTFSSWSDGGAQTHNVTAPTNPATWTATYASAATPPVNTTLPSISGQARVGRTLTVSSGTWSGTQPMTFSRQWFRCTTTNIGSCVAIAGATASSYVVVNADVNLYLRARVNAQNAAGSSAATSGPTARCKRSTARSSRPGNRRLRSRLLPNDPPPTASLDPGTGRSPTLEALGRRFAAARVDAVLLLSTHSLNDRTVELLVDPGHAAAARDALEGEDWTCQLGNRGFWRLHPFAQYSVGERPASRRVLAHPGRTVSVARASRRGGSTAVGRSGRHRRFLRALARDTPRPSCGPSGTAGHEISPGRLGPFRRLVLRSERVAQGVGTGTTTALAPPRAQKRSCCGGAGGHLAGRSALRRWSRKRVARCRRASAPRATTRDQRLSGRDSAAG